MGSCMYYLKATFASPREAQKAIPKIKEYIEINGKASEYWDEHRDDEDILERMAPLIEKYAITLTPKVVARSVNCGKNNAYAGALMPSEAEVSYGEGTVIVISVEEWHMASWDHHVAAMAFYFGAIEAEWISEEDFDMVDYLLGTENYPDR